MAEVNVVLKDYLNAKDGSLLIKKNGKWEITNFDELNMINKEKFEKLDNTSEEVNLLKKNAKHFVTYAKSHFLLVFNYFKIKVLSGEIDIKDDYLLKLDEEVLNGRISVEEALEKHELLKDTFNKVFLDNKELIEFPEV